VGGAVWGLVLMGGWVWMGLLLWRQAHGETKPDLPLTRQPT
jgi:hypothetical protein